ncbi:MAG: radical SAM protein [Negativicutes bacterium]|nr:radical SAM protein [Negativicutes bacterium]
MRDYIVPIFIPHYGCPHQCVFCDQRAITGVRQPIGGSEVAAVIAENLERAGPGRRVEIAYYGGSFTALPAEVQAKLLTPAKACLDSGQVAAIRVSTRPDAIDAAAAERLIAFGVSTVELGAQSLDDRVLTAAGRGHTAADTAKAVAILREYRLNTGLQLMPGLPKEDWASLIHTANRTFELRPDFIRIYPTVVLAKTRLADMYHAGQYRPLTLPAAVARAAFLKLLADRHATPVIRLGLQATDGLSAPGAIVAGPYHPAFGEKVAAFIFNLMVMSLLDDYPDNSGPLTIHHHPRDHSKLRGQSGENLTNWRSHAGTIRLVADWPQENELGIRRGELLFVINSAMLTSC